MTNKKETTKKKENGVSNLDNRDGKAKKKPCPKMQVVTNDASWYLRDGTPRFSGEFDDLQKIGVVNKVLPNGIALDASIQYGCAVAPPVDEQNSFYKQCATLLSKIRKKNTGANVYTIENVLVYVWKMIIATTMAAQLAKEIKAVAHVMPGNADSPWVALNIVNPNRDWEYEAAHLADTKNHADIVFKMIDALPLPRMSAIDRNIRLFSTLFADSKGGKPSFATFIPDYIADLDMNDDKVTIDFIGTGASGFNEHISDTLDKITAIIADIYEDHNANYTMLRGDMLKYWKPQPTCLSMLYSALPVAAMSAELASQLENASVLGRGSNHSAGDFKVTVSAAGTTLTLPLAGFLDPTIDVKATMDEQLINSRSGIPGDGELMAITALMPIVEKKNGAQSSKWNVKAHNGLVIYDAYALVSTGRNRSPAPTIHNVGTDLIDVHSATQSTMKAAFTSLQWMSSIMAHSPMFITDANNPKGYIWDVDFVGVISAQSLATAITRVVRSLYQVTLPETDRV